MYPTIIHALPLQDLYRSYCKISTHPLNFCSYGIWGGKVEFKASHSNLERESSSSTYMCVRPTGSISGEEMPFTRIIKFIEDHARGKWAWLTPSFSKSKVWILSWRS